MPTRKPPPQQSPPEEAKFSDAKPRRSKTVKDDKSEPTNPNEPSPVQPMPALRPPNFGKTAQQQEQQSKENRTMEEIKFNEVKFQFKLGKTDLLTFISRQEPPFRTDYKLHFPGKLPDDTQVSIPETVADTKEKPTAKSRYSEAELTGEKSAESAAARSESAPSIPLGVLRRVMKDTATGFTPSEKELYKTDTNLRKLIDVIVENSSLTFPDFSYVDSTERHLLGYADIESTFLRDTGLWANHGTRIIVIKLEKAAGILKMEGMAEPQLKVAFGWTKKGNEDIVRPPTLSDIKHCVSGDDILVEIPVDTNALGALIPAEQQKERFEGEAQFCVAVEGAFEWCFRYPVVIRLRNPAELAKKDSVAIDFGTCSTCVAYKKGGKNVLMSLVAEPKDKTAYENPTNLMVRNWDQLWEEWSNKGTPPIPVKRSPTFKTEYDFNQGHELRNELKDAAVPVLRAILPELKLIPYDQIKNKRQLDFEPLEPSKSGIRQVHLTSDPNAENDKTFNPIAFYGYLIGRAVNRPTAESIPTRYHITMPVRFSKEVRDAIIASLKAGISRALPKNISIEVIAGETEPVAYIRAVRGHEMILKNGWKPGTPMPFAVFDFGGGTLDFAFGVYRPAKDDELDDHDDMIEIYGTDGHDDGGAEHIIHSISYYLYKKHKDEMKTGKICFPLPQNEEKIEYFPDTLLSHTTIAATNMRRLNEKISRYIFKQQAASPDEQLSRDETMTLSSIEEVPVDITLSVDYDDAMASVVQPRIDALVKSFKELITKTFTDKERSAEGLIIFLSGNASRSVYLREAMEREFPDIHTAGRILFIEDSKAEGISPKSAVAFGQLLAATDPNVGIIRCDQKEENQVPFAFNVGTIDQNLGGVFGIKIEKSSTTTQWASFGRIDKESRLCHIYYTTFSDVKDSSNSRLKCHPLEVSEAQAAQGNFLYARPVQENVIEYRCGGRQTPPVPTEPRDESLFVELQFQH